jgi:hypothetical protein
MISGQLKSLARDMEEQIAQLWGVKRSLRSLPQPGIYWPKYMERFEQAHPEFRARLLELAPELTESEISLAIMLRLELGMPDIAKMLHLSLQAAQKLRAGLRAKLGLSRGMRELKVLKAL